ncbi:MAG: gliding motility-associated C-terminal domain-containing protein [Flavobacteriales bacterium]|nr:gliding motility-associated C-terminal domain-containing protein [Flavobacteriales bacterium]
MCECYGDCYSDAVPLIAQLGGVPQAGGAWSGPSPVIGGNYDPATMNAGVYTYTVTGIAPCANASATVTVTENAASNAGTNGTLTLCSNGAVVALSTGLGGTPSAGGAWSGPSPVVAGSYDPSTMTAGVYTYTVAGVAPCANASATITVTENPAANAGSNGSITLCSSDAAVSLFAQLGGVPQAGGAWSGPSPVVGGSYDPATMTAGAYTYTVTGVAPCVNASATVTVTENATTNAGTNGSITVCDIGGAVNLFNQLGGGPTAGGAWSGPSPVVGNSYDPATMTAGVYTYTVTGVAPCANASATVTVNETSSPNAGTNGSITVCGDGAVANLFTQLGGAPQAGGTWSGPSVIVGGNYDPATMGPGVYTYALVATAPCVSASATVTVTENAPTNAGTNGSVTVCDIGGAVNLFNQLGGGPTAGGAWSGPSPVVGNSYDPATMTAGVYTYTVTGVAPCANASATVTVNETSSPNAGTNGSITVCGDGGVTNLFTQLGGAPQAGGTWSGPSVIVGGNYDPATMGPGVYTYALVATAPCVSASATVTVTENAPTNAGTNGSITVCDIGGAVNLFNQLGGGPTAGGAWSGPSPVVGNSYDPATMTAGVYTYTVTGVAPCANASATVTVNETSSPNAGTNGSITVCGDGAVANLFTQLGGAPQAGGTWSGPSVIVGGNYDPATMGPGVYTYSLVATAPCVSASATVTVTENAPTNAGTNGSVTVCDIGGAVNLFNQLGGGPTAGGAWSGPSPVIGNSYDPATMTAGVYTYTVTGVAPCANASATVTVNETSSPNAGTNGSITVCGDGAVANLFTQLGGAPQAGGTWSGPSVIVGGNYDPATMGPGVYTYALVATAPCVSASATVTVTENAPTNAGTNGSVTVCDIGGAVNLFNQLGGGPTAGGAWSGPSPVVGNSYDPATMTAGVYTYTVTGVAPCANASATVTVNETSSPNAGTNGSITVCNSDPAFNLATVLGGSPDVGGTWSGPSVLVAGSFDPGAHTPGVYTYSIAGSPPCASASSTVTVSVEVAPDAGLAGSIDLCPASPVVDLFTLLGGSPQIGGTWTGPSGMPFGGTFDPSADASGDHTYTITGTACASSSAVVSVNVLAGPDAGGDNAIVACNTQGAFTLISQLTGTPDGGGTWTNSAGDPVGASFNSSTGASDVFTYTVSGSANCPDDEATLTITVNIAPQAGINGNLTLCASSTPVSLFDGLSGTLDAGGVWTDAAGNAHATILNPATDVSGSYTYTVTGAAPCANASAVVTVVINPVPYAGEDGGLVLCTTSPNVSLISAVGGAPQLGGSWTGPDGVPSSGSFVPSTGTPGVYTYTIIGINPCVNDTSEVTITVSIAANAGVGGSVSLCDGDPAIDLFAQLGGSPDATGVWTDPSGIVSTAQFDPLIDTPGTYTYTVTAIAPCPTETATIDVGVIAPVIASFLATSNGSCAPTLVNFSHDYTGPGTCTWILGNGDVIMDCAPIDVTYTQPGSYDVTLIIDANNGCGADTVTIADAVTVYLQPLATFDQLPAQLNTLDPVAFFNNTTNGANTYAWLINGEFITDEVDMQYRFPGEIGDTYGICLVAYAANSCADTVCKFITIEDGMQVFVPNTFTPDDHAPNNTFKPIVTGIDPRFYLFEIYDRWGNRLLSTTDPDVFWDGKVDGTLAQQDVYVWKLIVKDAYSGDRVERIGHVTLLR